MHSSRLVALARIGRPHGLRGEVRLDPGEGSIQNLSRYSRFFAGPLGGWGGVPGDAQPIAIEAARRHGRLMLVKFAGVESPEGAARLTGLALYVERAEMPPLEPGEYYHADLIGRRVLGEGGEDLGRVADVFATGAHDILVVRGSGPERLVPVTAEYVLSLELEDEFIRVRLPEEGE